MKKGQVSIMVVVGVFFAAIIVLLVTVAVNRSEPEIKERIKSGYPVCVDDLGCVASYTSCCDCSRGGVKRCVTLEEKAFYDDLMDPIVGDCDEEDFASCPGVDKCFLEDPVCACVEGSCKNV
jgi:hypothetical protein